jgi:murein L,D-transpeptidase YafK
MRLLLVLLLIVLSSPVMARDPRRGNVPQSPELLSLNRSAGVANDSAVLLRIFKEERELELLRAQSDGSFVLVKTYPICAFSGDLGPKLRQGDRQAPEGFYSITASSLNPQSVAWLSINTGFPNERDRQVKATGSSVMIHGDCASAGCFAMKDEPMEEIYAAVRDALRNGQRQIQLQIFPFRMNWWNMAAHRASNHGEFWAQLKAGYDAFQSTKRPLDVRIVSGRYVID